MVLCFIYTIDLLIYLFLYALVMHMPRARAFFLIVSVRSVPSVLMFHCLEVRAAKPIWYLCNMCACLCLQTLLLNTLCYCPMLWHWRKEHKAYEYMTPTWKTLSLSLPLNLSGSINVKELLTENSYTYDSSSTNTSNSTFNRITHDNLFQLI